MLPITVKDVVKASGGALLCGDENTVILGATTNSKEVKNGTLFVPIIGERVDGHRFIESAIESGAVCTFTSEHEKADENMINSGCSYILVEDNLKALILTAEYVRGKYDIPIIGISGSVGKTTTKEMIAAALETQLNILKTSGNMNSQIGVSLMMFRIQEEQDAAVIEMGVSEPNEMDNLVNIARPCFAVITNIGVSHISQFKTQSNIRKEKLKIINSFSEDSDLTTSEDILKKRLEQVNLEQANVLFINGDDPLLSEIKSFRDGKIECDFDDKTSEIIKKIKIVTYGMSNECDYYADNTRVIDGITYFEAVHGEERTMITLNVLGKHNIYNALVAVAVAECFGISSITAAIGLKEYKPLAMRGDIIRKNGIMVINDTYNASPDSMKGGIDILLSIENKGRKVAVLADMFELGDESYKGHYEVGEFIAKKSLEDTGKIDILITVGNESKAIAKAVSDNKCTTDVLSFDSNEEVIEFLTKNLKTDDAIIIKGSRGMHTDKIVDAITQ